MEQTLQERIREYESCQCIRLTRKLPVVIRIEGRNFSKLTRDLSKPYSKELISLFSGTLVRLMKQIDGAVFGYYFSDSITIISLNDQKNTTEPWLGNDQQRIASLTSALATYEFNDILWELDDPPDIQGQPLFLSSAFIVPNYMEAINCLIERQQECIKNAITAASYVELSKRFNRKEVQRFLEGRHLDQRLALLREECGINYDAHYPLAFRRGVACYRVPQIIDGQVERHKWAIDLDLLLFSESRDFLFQIISSGHDIFRPERDTKQTDERPNLHT